MLGFFLSAIDIPGEEESALYSTSDCFVRLTSDKSTTYLTMKNITLSFSTRLTSLALLALSAVAPQAAHASGGTADTMSLTDEPGNWFKSAIKGTPFTVINPAIIDPDPNGDNNGADAAAVGTILLVNASKGAGATDCTGGQGVKPLPMTHDGWIQPTVALSGTGQLSPEVEGWISKLTPEQKDPGH